MKTFGDVQALSRMAVGAVFLGVLALGGACPAGEIYFQPANGDWDVAANWSPSHVPTTGDTAMVASTANVTTNVTTQPSGLGVRYGSGVLNMQPGGSLTVNGQAVIGQGGGGLGTLYMLGGSLSATNGIAFSNQANCWGHAYHSSGSVTAIGSDLNVSSGSGTNRSEYWLSGASSTVSASGFRLEFGLFDQNGGTVTLAGGEKYIGQWGGPGEYHLTSGTLNMGSSDFYVGLNAAGTFNMNGGSITGPTTGTLKIGGYKFSQGNGTGAGAFNVTNGTLVASKLQLGDTGTDPVQGTGLLKITGSSASPITVTGSGAAFTMGTNATLSAVIDSSGAITPINVTNGNATLAGKLDMGLLGFTPNNPQTFDLLTTLNGTITNNGLGITWAGLNQAWQYSIVGNKTLRVMYLPEPGALTLLALGGLALLRRRGTTNGTQPE